MRYDSISESFTAIKSHLGSHDDRRNRYQQRQTTAMYSRHWWKMWAVYAPELDILTWSAAVIFVSSSPIPQSSKRMHLCLCASVIYIWQKTRRPSRCQSKDTWFLISLTRESGKDPFKKFFSLAIKRIQLWSRGKRKFSLLYSLYFFFNTTQPTILRFLPLNRTSNFIILNQTHEVKHNLTII